MGHKLRALHFANFDELADDVAALRSAEVERGGEWDLPLVEDHLAKAIVAPLDGAGPKLFWPLTWAARWVIRRMARRQRYPNFKFPAPKFMRPQVVPPEQAHAAMDAAIARAKQVTGPTVTTRAYGTVAAADWRAIQLLHAAHHLSYLQAK